MMITLTSDFGYKDSFVGIMKGVIAGINPQARIVDLSHGVAPQDVMGAALLLRHSVKYFPPRTIHVAVVDPGVGSARRPIMIEAAGNYFVGPDNGVLSLACAESQPLRTIHLSNTAYHRPSVSKTFHGRDIFAPVAAHLSLGVDAASFGEPVEDFAQLAWPALTVTSTAVQGEIVYIDHFGNLLTNIGAGQLQAFAKDKLAFNLRGIVIGGLASHYAAAGAGGLVALINSWEVLEIAVYQGNAQQRCGARIGDKVEARVL
jgi:S-adenosyl-L-methionine hydrolase (adenosine-forming)